MIKSDIIFLYMNKNSETFGKRLAAIRKARGLTQRDLAKLVGISNRMIAYYEAQTERPPAAKLDTLAKTLSVSTDELLGVKPAKNLIFPENSRLWKRLKIVDTLPPKAQKQIVEYAEMLAKVQNK